MIRGNIEFASNDVIQGWIFAESGRVRDRTVLAFLGENCVGAGKVDAFRADLADAGMGDGYLGFSFPISATPAFVGAVVVKLEGSDAVLLQNGASVTTGAAPVAGLDRSAVRRKLGALKWALKHGRIAQSDFDYLRILWSLGVYERGLVRRQTGDEAITMDPPHAVAASLLEAYVETEAQIEAVRVDDAAQFAAELARLAARDEGAPVLAVHGTSRSILRVLEGSHVDEGAGESGARASHFVDYPLSAANLVMLDARAKTELILPQDGTVDLYSAKPALA